jgi:S1-C subfamily serine protease
MRLIKSITGVQLLAALVLVAGVVTLTSSKSKTKAELAKASVMITTPNKRSGGTGVILRSEESTSTILTNAHVCKIAERGAALVSTYMGDFAVKRYHASEEYDLCLIQVDKNLKVNTSIASSAPDKFEEAIIVGHPALYPEVISSGHFSDSRIVPIMVGVRRCKPEDWNKSGALCLFLGGIPIIKNFESVLVTATIMPGSSGSAVYDSSGDLAAVVFAGRGELGYAWAMPHEAVARFISDTLDRLTNIYTEAQNTFEYSDFDESRKMKSIVNTCKSSYTFPIEVQEVCDIAIHSPIVE